MIYLDNHATTPVDPRVVEAMLPYLSEAFGNAASGHAYGWNALEAVDEARRHVATLANADPSEIIFTSGATESDNLAIKGVVEKAPASKRHIITSTVEHPAVADTLAYLAKRDVEVTELPVSPSGLIDPADVEAAIREDTLLVTIIAAQNEIGTVQPLAAIGAITRRRGVLFHTDAAQAFGRIPIDVQAMSIDLASLSGHKMYGPKGIGALFVKRKRPPRVRLAPQLHGGGHERGLRPGTLAVPGIVGFGVAAKLALENLTEEALRLRSLRDRLLGGLENALEDIEVHGDLEARLPGNLNLSFRHVHGEALVSALKRLAVSSGSACATGGMEASPVLQAIGVSPEMAHAALRFGIGRFNTEAEIDIAIDEVTRVVRRLREISGHPTPAPTSSRDAG